MFTQGWRSRILARCKAVLEANGVFSPSIKEGCRLREQSRGRGTGARSLPAPSPAADVHPRDYDATGFMEHMGLIGELQVANRQR